MKLEVVLPITYASPAVSTAIPLSAPNSGESLVPSRVEYTVLLPSPESSVMNSAATPSSCLERAVLVGKSDEKVMPST